MDNSSNTSNVTISNMKITGYVKSSDAGGAIKIEENISSTTFSNLLFETNKTTGNNSGGGAVAIEQGSSATFNDCSFITNDAGYSNSNDFTKGGAVYADGEIGNAATVTLNRCLFSNNTCNDYGGAQDNSK